MGDKPQFIKLIGVYGRDNRSWAFISAPLTPNGLNGGKAGSLQYFLPLAAS
jgi:hypothetical protein